jgi:hypothetical protein
MRIEFIPLGFGELLEVCWVKTSLFTALIENVFINHQMIINFDRTFD